MTARPADGGEPHCISGQAGVAGVIGWPVGHSLSPRLHGFWLRQYRLDGAYVPLPVCPEDLHDALAALPKLGFRGVNVTVPHKVRTLALVQRATSAARLIGAVNTIVVDPQGLLIGSNTDGFGFIENIRNALPGWSAGSGPAAVLGAGGAARAIVFALIEAGAPEVRLLNRTVEHAEALATDFGDSVRPLPWKERQNALPGAALLVNTTILGMHGQPPLDIDVSALPRSAVVADIVYAPLETALIAQARALGNTAVDGLGMLLHQARPGFAAWFGHMPIVSPELREHLLSCAMPA